MLQVHKQLERVNIVAVNYFGHIFYVPETHKYLVMTTEGVVRAYEDEPYKVLRNRVYHEWSNMEDSLVVGQLHYTGDLADSMIEITPNLIFPFFAVVSIVVERLEKFRVFSYFNFQILTAHTHIKCFATRPDGVVLAFGKKPKLNDDGTSWAEKHSLGAVAAVDYIGDWKQSLSFPFRLD